MAHRVIAANFGSQTAAFDAAHDIQNLAEDNVIKIERGAIVTKDAQGNLTIPDARGLGGSWGLLGGGIIGGLLGLLLGPAGAVLGAATGASLGAASNALSDVANLGLSDDFLRNVGSKLEPGQTILIAQLDEESSEPVDRAVHSHGGRVYRDNVR